MAHLMSNSLLLYIPKTGSDWLRRTCFETVKGGVTEVGDWHCDLAGAKRILEGQQTTIPFTGAFVRHPFEWYRSAWIYYRVTGRFPRRDEDPPVEHQEFGPFVENCLAAEPGGYVTALYRRFLGTQFDSVSFVGRQENLISDLVRFLRWCGRTESPAYRQLAQTSGLTWFSGVKTRG